MCHVNISNASWSVLVASLVIIGDATRIAADDPSLTRHAVVAAADINARFFADKEHFGGLTDAGLRAELSDESDDVAIRAAWEITWRAIRSDASDGNDRQLALSWFLGYLEGRLRCAVPKDWRRYAESATQADGFVQFDAALVPRYTRYGEWLIRNGIVMNETTVAVEPDVGAPDVSLSSLRSIADSRRHLSLAASQSEVFGVLHDAIVKESLVFCKGRAAPERAWKMSVWGGFQSIDSGQARHSHFVDIVFSGDSVLVFGAGDSSIHVERFDRASGKPTLRFGSAY